MLVTLVGQGLTLTPLVRRLRVGSDADEHAEITGLRLQAMRAAVDALRADAGNPPDPASRAVILQYEGRLHTHDVLQQTLRGASGPHGGPDGGQPPGEALEDLVQRAFRRGNDVEREIVLAARATGAVSPAAADEVLHDIEVRAARTGP